MFPREYRLDPGPHWLKDDFPDLEFEEEVGKDVCTFDLMPLMARSAVHCKNPFLGICHLLQLDDIATRSRRCLLRI